MIKYLDIQLNNICNKSCNFCPPQSINKPKNIEKISENSQNKIITQLEILKKNNLIINNPTVGFSRYYEPFTDIELVSGFIKKIRNIFPEAYLMVHTNGDLITPEKINKLENIHIIVSHYSENLIESLCKTFETFGLDLNIEDKNEEECSYIIKENKNILIKVYYDKINKYSSSKNFRSRGGLIKEFIGEERVERCNIAGAMFGIDVNGAVMPCCDFSTMNPEHLVYSLGNIFTDDILEIVKNAENFNSNLIERCRFCNASYLKIIGDK